MSAKFEESLKQISGGLIKFDDHAFILKKKNGFTKGRQIQSTDYHIETTYVQVLEPCLTKWTINPFFVNVIQD